MATKKGLIKRTALPLYSKPRKGGVFAIEIKEADELIQARVTNGEQDIVIATELGKSIRFSESQVRPTGRKTMGVRGIMLGSKQDQVIGMLVVKREGTIMVATEKGFGKRTDITSYRQQNRGGKGVVTIKVTNKTGKLVKILEAKDSDDVMIITDKGVMIRQSIESIRVIGRNTQGVKLLKLDENSFISSVTSVINDNEEQQDELQK